MRNNFWIGEAPESASFDIIDTDKPPIFPEGCLVREIFGFPRKAIRVLFKEILKTNKPIEN